MASVSRKLRRNLKQESLDVVSMSARAGISYGYGTTRRARKSRRLTLKGGKNVVADLNEISQPMSEEIAE